MIRLVVAALYCLALPSVALSGNTCREMLRDMRALAQELKGFDRSHSFKTYGFGAGGPHSNWLDQAKALQGRYTEKGPALFGEIASDDVALPGDIIQLGLSKVSCVAMAHCDQELMAGIENRLKKMRCR